MSTANLGVSLGSALYGAVSEHASYPQNYFFMGMLLLFLLGTLAVFRKHEANPVLEPTEAGGSTGR